MGYSTFLNSDYVARTTLRSATGTSAFKYDDDIKKGKTSAKVHDLMDPKGVNRECRDSVDHPITVPVAIVLDTTGSMGQIPLIIQKNLPNLMGTFLNDKASGKKYLGDGYPSILISAIDDFEAMKRSRGNYSGCLQVGQFESGIEIDDTLERLWITGNGGSNQGESYDLGMYFIARHTVTDHYEKRGMKGHLFIFGDEPFFEKIDRQQISEVIGDNLQSSLSLSQIVEELKQKWNVFFVIPFGHCGSRGGFVRDEWQKLLGDENVLELRDAEKVCEFIAATVALCEGGATIDDITSDLGNVSNALVPLSRSYSNNAVSKFSADNLPAIGTGGPITRL